MNDRELLELAAKAAGIKLLGWTNAYRGIDFGCFETNGPHWNALNDDGDALRLAVKLNRFPTPLKDNSGVINGYEKGRNSWKPIIENFGNDALAATRRSIVRAAAEIGKSMP